MKKDIVESGSAAVASETVELLRRAQAGERAALDALLGRYYERVRRIVRRRLDPHLRGCLDSGDVLQETFAAAARGLDDFEMHDDDSLIHWLARTAQRKILDLASYHHAVKRDCRRRVALETHGDGDPGAPGTCPDTPAEATLASDRAALVRECLAQLPAPYRKLIELRDFGDRPWAAVARATGRPSEAAARMMHRKALLELARLLKRRRVND